MANLTLYIQSDGFLSTSAQCEDAECQRFFSWDDPDEGWQEALSSLSENDKIYMIIDMVEEDVDFVWRPKLLPWEKAAYLKMEQQRLQNDQVLFHHLAWTGVVQQKEDGRKEELLAKFLVHTHAPLARLLDYLEEHQLRLEAIYSITFLIQKLFVRQVRRKLSISSNQARQPLFLIVRLSHHRFRQIFLLEGQVRISREVLIDQHIESEIGIQIALMNETKAAVKYLYNQKVIPYNAPVSTIIVDHCQAMIDSWRDAIESELKLGAWSEDESWFHKETSFETLFKKWHLPVELIEGWFVFSQYVLRQKVPTFYRNAYLQKIHTYYQLSTALVVINILLVLTFVFMLVYEGVTAYLTKQRTEIYQSEYLQFSKEKTKLQSLVNLQYDAKDLKASVDFSNSLLALRGPEPAGIDFTRLSGLISQHNHLLIQTISWRTPSKFDAKSYDVVLSGWVYPFEGQYAPLVNWVDGLVKQLQTQPGIQGVKLTKEPLDRDLSQTLTIQSTQEVVNGLPFEIELKVGRYGK